MKILIASTPATGHINPMFSLGNILVKAGHEVVGLSGNAMRDRIEASGAKFCAFPPEADLDLRNVLAVFPELANISPGLEMSRFYSERGLIDPMRAQHEGLLQVLRDFPADVIIADNFLCGVMPMLLGPRSERPPIVLCGTMSFTATVTMERQILPVCRLQAAKPSARHTPPSSKNTT